MTVYLDLVIGSTLAVNYSMLKTIKLVFREKNNVIRMILALFLSVASLGFFFVSSPVVFSMRYLYGIIIALVAFEWHDIREGIIKTVIFYLMNFAFIGTLEIFNIQNSWLIVIALFYIICLVLVESYRKLVINPKSLAYDVGIKGTNLSLRGFLDTGNQSVHDGIPIIYVDYRYLNDAFTYFQQAKIKTISGETMVSLYQGNRIVINGKEHQVYFAFTRLKDYDVLLNLILF